MELIKGKIWSRSHENPLYFYHINRFYGCASRKPKDQSEKIVSIQIIDRNGFTETSAIKIDSPITEPSILQRLSPTKKCSASSAATHLGKLLQKSPAIMKTAISGSTWRTDGRAHGVYQEWFPNGK